jgi:hypothetical protein
VNPQVNPAVTKPVQALINQSRPWWPEWDQMLGGVDAALIINRYGRGAAIAALMRPCVEGAG